MDDDLPVRLRERADARDLAREYLEPVATLLREAAAEIGRLRLQLERDARTYATMQAGMESQAELADALKQETRRQAAEADRLRARVAVLESTARALERTVAGSATPTAGDNADNDNAE